MLFGVCVMGVSAEGSYSCSLNTTAASAKVGDTIAFTVDVSEGLSGLEAYIYYDAVCYSLVDAYSGDIMLCADNTKNTGEIHIACAAGNSSKAGTVYTFVLKVLRLGGEVKLKVVDATDDQNKNVAVTMNNMTVSFADGGKKSIVDVPKSEDEVNEILNPTKRYNKSSKPASTTVDSSKADKTLTTVFSQNTSTAKAEETSAVGKTADNSKDETKYGIIAAVTVGVLSLAVVIVLIIKKRADAQTKAAAPSDEAKDEEKKEEKGE